MCSSVGADAQQVVGFCLPPANCRHFLSPSPLAQVCPVQIGNAWSACRRFFGAFFSQKLIGQTWFQRLESDCLSVFYTDRIGRVTSSLFLVELPARSDPNNCVYKGGRMLELHWAGFSSSFSTPPTFFFFPSPLLPFKLSMFFIDSPIVPS